MIERAQMMLNKRKTQPPAVKRRRPEPIVQVPTPLLKRSMAFLIEDDENDEKRSMAKCVESNVINSNKSVATFQGSSDDLGSESTLSHR